MSQILEVLALFAQNTKLVHNHSGYLFFFWNYQYSLFFVPWGENCSLDNIGKHGWQSGNEVQWIHTKQKTLRFGAKWHVVIICKIVRLNVL